MKYIISVDPGTNGGLALTCDQGEVEYCPMPDTAKGIKEWLDQAIYAAAVGNRAVIMVVEHQQAMPGNKGRVNVVATGTMMRNFGRWEIFALCMGIPYHEVRPNAWKKVMGVSSDKQTAIAKCEQIFPGVNLLATDRCKKKHDGMAEALLIGEYARRVNL